MKSKMISTFTCILVMMFVVPAFSHPTEYYYHDEGDIRDRRNWLSTLPNWIRLQDISIPGTHDSMARFGGPAAQCQTLTLDQQLRAGIRALDIRCRCSNGRFAIYHGPVFQNTNFDDVLTIIQRFLRQNPSEAILMRVQEEYTPDRCTRLTFRGIFEDVYWNNPLYNGMWYIPNALGNSFNPTLGQTRGKVVVLVNFDTFNPAKTFGIPYPQAFDIQDQYEIANRNALYDKWTAIKDHMNRVNLQFIQNGYRAHQFCVNYLSGSNILALIFPYFVASGHLLSGTDAARIWSGSLSFLTRDDVWPDFPREGGTIYYEGTNVLTGEAMRRIGHIFVGIVMADFPGSGLIDAIITTNYLRPKRFYRTDSLIRDVIHSTQGIFSHLFSVNRRSFLPSIITFVPINISIHNVSAIKIHEKPH